MATMCRVASRIITVIVYAIYCTTIVIFIFRQVKTERDHSDNGDNVSFWNLHQSKRRVHFLMVQSGNHKNYGNCASTSTVKRKLHEATSINSTNF